MSENQPNIHAISQQRTRDHLFREIYSNVSQTQIGPFDISVNFQKISEITPGVPGVVDQVVVTFSPQHFKALVNSLASSLEAYERSFGTLSINDADTTPLRTAQEIADSISAARKAGALPTLSSNERTPPSGQFQPASQKRGKSL